MKVLVPCTRTIRRLSNSGRYQLGQPTWSVKGHNNLEDPKNVDLVNENTVNYLSKLACIDLTAIPNADSLNIKDSIQRDVNVILKCAQSLQVSHSFNLRLAYYDIVNIPRIVQLKLKILSNIRLFLRTVHLETIL